MEAARTAARPSTPGLDRTTTDANETIITNTTAANISAGKPTGILKPSGKGKSKAAKPKLTAKEKKDRSVRCHISACIFPHLVEPDCACRWTLKKRYPASLLNSEATTR